MHDSVTAIYTQFGDTPTVIVHRQLLNTKKVPFLTNKESEQKHYINGCRETRTMISMLRFLHKTSISNLRLSLRSGSWCSSARTFISPMVQGFGGLNTYRQQTTRYSLSLRSGSWCSSARTFISPMAQGFGGLNTYRQHVTH